MPSLWAIYPDTFLFKTMDVHPYYSRTVRYYWTIASEVYRLDHIVKFKINFETTYFEDLKMRIIKGIKIISGNVISNVPNEFLSRIRHCQERYGGHFRTLNKIILINFFYRIITVHELGK